MTPHRFHRQSGSAGAWVTLTLVVAAGSAFLWLRGRGASASTALDPARIVAVEARDVIDSVNANGRVEPLARVAVMSRASGIIEALYADEGDRVQADQVLAELDREQLQAQFEQDEAGLLAAQARLEASRARLAEAQVRTEDPEIDFLRRELERLDGLRERGDVSIKEHEDAARALAAAEFRVRLVEASLPVLKADVTEAEAGLASSEANLDRSATALKEATILCPIDGMVLVRDKEVGDGVSSILTAGGNATEIMVLGDLSQMHIEARVDEVDLGRIHDGMPALVTVDAHRGKELWGEVRRIAPAGSIDNNGIVTFEVEVSVEDPEGLLRPDMTADAKLVIDRRDGVPSLPQTAFQLGEDGAWRVQKVEGDQTRSVEVELGLSDGLMTEIRSGLSVDDRVLLPLARGGR